MGVPDRDQLRRALATQAGDSLGLCHDVEASFAIADAAARRFITTDHSEAALDEWRAVVDELMRQHSGGSEWDAEVFREGQLLLLRACQAWLESGEHSQSPAEYLKRSLVGVFAMPRAKEPTASAAQVLAYLASTLLGMAWGLNMPRAARAG